MGEGWAKKTSTGRHALCKKPSRHFIPRLCIQHCIKHNTFCVDKENTNVILYTHQNHEKKACVLLTFTWPVIPQNTYLPRDDIHNKVTNITFSAVKEKTCVMSKSPLELHKVMYCHKFINTPSFQIHLCDYVYNTVSNITHLQRYK